MLQQEENHLYLPHVCSVVLISVISTTCPAADISAFKLTGVEGYAGLRFNVDEQNTGEVNQVPFRETRTAMKEEVFVLTHSYIYHPNFLKMDLGVGPLFVQDELDNSLGRVTDKNTFYNVLADLYFLEGKPYPVRLYYHRDHPSISLSLTDRFEQQNTDYGFTLQLLRPLSPVNFTMEANRNETKGQGFNLIINDVVDQAKFRAYLPIDQAGYAQLLHSSTRSESNTHYIGQPQQLSKVQIDATTLDSRILWGDRGEFQLSNYLSYTDRSELRPLKELRYTPSLTWRHSEQFRSFYNFSYLDSKQEEVSTRNVTAKAGAVRKWGETFDLGADARVENNKTTGLQLNNYGANLTATYSPKIDIGQLSFSASMGYDYNDRKAASSVPVRNLRLVMMGTTPVMLPQDYIFRTTIRVWEIFTAGGETELTVGVGAVCSAGVDILATAIDAKTQLTNCNGIAGQQIQVRVDYDYDPGGTVAYSNFSQNYRAALNFLDYYNVYIGYRDNQIEVINGVPTLALEEIQNTSYGANAKYPWRDTIMLELDVKYTNQNGTITSYDHQSYNASVQFAFFSGTLRFAEQRTITDYVNSTEGVDLTRHSVQMRFRPIYRMNFQFEVSDEKDVGSSLQRRTRNYSLNAEWRIRQLFLGAEVRLVEELQGTNERDRYMLRMIARREF